MEIIFDNKRKMLIVKLSLIEKIIYCSGNLESSVKNYYKIDNYNNLYLIRKCAICVPFILKIGTYYYNPKKRYNPDLFNFIILLLAVLIYEAITKISGLFKKTLIVLFLLLILAIIYFYLKKGSYLSLVNILNKKDSFIIFELENSKEKSKKLSFVIVNESKIRNKS